jgi:hypothetical protein
MNQRQRFPWLQCCAALLAALLPLPAAATVLTAQLQTVTGAAPRNFLRLTLKNCGGYIPRVTGSSVIGGRANANGETYWDVPPNPTTGLVSISVQDESTLTCGASSGVAFYNVALYQGDPAPVGLGSAPQRPTLLSANDYDITGDRFDLSSATPKSTLSISAPALAHGIPPGGATGQALTKVDGTDYHAAWTDQAGWGSITGTLANQTDLQSALNGKASTSSLGTETTRAEAAEASNATAITAEDTARAAAVTAEASTRTTADITNATAISTETTRAETAEALAAQKSANLSDLASTVTARTNLGLGTAATHPATDFDASGSAAAVQTNLTAEASTRASADTTNAAAISTETSRATAAEALLAPLASPALTGNPTVPTQAPGTNNTRASSTAYADAAVGVETSRATTAEENFVDLTTNQTIAGNKTFSGSIAAGTAITTPSIAINGGTPITSTSSANSQAVTCPTGGTSTQYCGADGAWHANGGAVSSVFTRTGSVTAQSGDYTPAQVGAVSTTGDTMTGSLAAPNVTVNSQSLSPATPLMPLFKGPLAPKLVVMSGDSTTAVALLQTSSLCNRTGPGQELAGMLCAANSTYSIDGSKNVTVVVLGTLPANCTVGAYVSLDVSSTFSSNAVASATPTFAITAVTSTSYTYNNTLATASISSTGANGVSSCSFINNGSNGQTQNGFNTAGLNTFGSGGVGSLAATLAIEPDLDIHIMGINDVRGGTKSASQLEGYIQTYINSVRASSHKTAILLATPNSLEANDNGSNGWVTSASTTSSTAVGGAGSVTITLASMLNSISGLVTPGLTLAQEVTNGSASLVIDDGSHGTQETVSITAISGNTVTATFANAHTSGFTVVPNLATMAQAYSNILHDAIMYFEGMYPNVQVADTQSYVFGRLVANGPTWLMSNQLHPTGSGYDARSAYLASVLNKDNLAGGSHSTTANPGLPDMHYARTTQYSPMLALNAMNASYTAPWNTYAVENPDYYTLVGSGVLNTYASASYIRIQQEVDSLTSTGSFGIIPGQGSDIVEFVGYGVLQLGPADTFTNTFTYTQISTGVSIPWTMPNYGQGLPPQVRVYRAKYLDPAAENYAKDTKTYKTQRYALVNNTSSSAFRLAGGMAADPVQLPSTAENSFNPATDKIVCQGIGDLSTIIGSYSSMTCTLNVGNWYCSGGSSVPTMTSTYCQVFYTDPAEQVARKFVAKTAIYTPQLIANAEYDNGTCTTAKTVTPVNGTNQKVALTNAQTCALTFTQPVLNTTTLRLKVIQSAVSTFNGAISGCKWPAGTVPTITATSAAVDMISVYLDGTNAYCTINQDLR